MSKEIFFKDEGRKRMKVGIDKTVDAIKGTMGAAGRNVFLWRQFGAPHNTNDGYTIAKEISFIDPVENMGAELVKEVAKKTVDETGDGTSAASLLLQSIITQGMGKISEKVNVINLKKGIEKAVTAVVSHIKTLSKKVDTDETLLQIATISANNDAEIGEQIVKAIKGVGKNGLVTVEAGKEYKTEVEFADGMQVDAGYASSYFVNNPQKLTYELDECFVFLYGKDIADFKTVLPFIEKVVLDKPVLIIAKDFKGDSLRGILSNLKNGLRMCCVRSVAEEVMEDIAILTGATYINDKSNLKIDNVNISHLGKASKVVVGSLSTSIIDGYGKEEKIESRIKEIEAQIEASISDFDKGNLRMRLAKLDSGVAIIKVGGQTETEIAEKKDRTDDAKCATLAAAEEGFVAGGGTALLYSVKHLETITGDNEDEQSGIDIVKMAIQYPFLQILENAGLDANEYAPKIMHEDYGFGVNVKNNKIENFFESGVIDPTKVVRKSLENAASVAALFLITECVVSENI
jgi:chaperonin GroEL